MEQLLRPLDASIDAPDSHRTLTFPNRRRQCVRYRTTGGAVSGRAALEHEQSSSPELFEGAWYTDSNLRDIAFKRRFEEKYPETTFATHMMPYAYDSVNMIVRAFESGKNPAVYLRTLRTYDGIAGVLTKAPGKGNFASTPAVWTIANGKPALLHQ